MDTPLLPKEPLIYSSMSRIAGQIGKIATRTAQVVAGTLTPGRTDQASTRFDRRARISWALVYQGHGKF